MDIRDQVAAVLRKAASDVASGRYGDGCRFNDGAFMDDLSDALECVAVEVEWT